MSEYPIYSSVFAPLQKQIDFVTDAVKKGIAKVEDNPARIRRLDIRLAVGTDTVRPSSSSTIRLSSVTITLFALGTSILIAEVVIPSLH